MAEVSKHWHACCCFTLAAVHEALRPCKSIKIHLPSMKDSPALEIVADCIVILSIKHHESQLGEGSLSM